LLPYYHTPRIGGRKLLITKCAIKYWIPSPMADGNDNVGNGVIPGLTQDLAAEATTTRFPPARE